MAVACLGLAVLGRPFELPEIAVPCGLNHPIELVGVAHPRGQAGGIASLPAADIDDPAPAVPWIVAASSGFAAASRKACAAVGPERIAVSDFTFCAISCGI
ncbi:MAG: hypothetical protein QF926_02045 [Alphaproteobacteria bacterium]|jgi:hypothetical protein|nr:hypothetical protein [Alphaproteobacteria bacterium]MDP6515391.1 hypothetical protein [Alphaproteobacteria bacterium]